MYSKSNASIITKNQQVTRELWHNTPKLSSSGSDLDHIRKRNSGDHLMLLIDILSTCIHRRRIYKQIISKANS